MTDDKLISARRALAQIADLVTEALFVATRRGSGEQTAIKIYAQALISIREIAQDAAEATLDTVETRT